MRFFLLALGLLLAACEPSSSSIPMLDSDTPVVSAAALSEADLDHEAIEAVLMQYNEGTETRSLEAFDGILHPEARQYVAGPRFMALDTPTFLQLLSDETIGGVERETIIHGIEVDGALASAHVTFDSEPALFDNYVSLIKTDETWQIMSMVIEMAPR